MTEREPTEVERGTEKQEKAFADLVGRIGGSALLELFIDNDKEYSCVFPTEDEQVGITVSPDTVSFRSVQGGDSGTLNRGVAEAIVYTAAIVESQHP